jgi:hypothetical protein
MPRLRFETVRDLLEAFPLAERLIDIEPNDEPSLQFLQALVARGDSDTDLDKAVGFCAFLLPRREAVWWGCRTVKTFIPERSPEEEQAISVAEEWVREPEDERRVAALELGRRASSKLATTYLALAAGWSGGRLTVGADEAVPVPPHQTAQVVRAAVLIAACRAHMDERPAVLRRCLEDGIRLASDQTHISF